MPDVNSFAEYACSRSLWTANALLLAHCSVNSVVYGLCMNLSKSIVRDAAAATTPWWTTGGCGPACTHSAWAASATLRAASCELPAPHHGRRTQVATVSSMLHAPHCWRARDSMVSERSSHAQIHLCFTGADAPSRASSAFPLRSSTSQQQRYKLSRVRHSWRSRMQCERPCSQDHYCLFGCQRYSGTS